MTESALQWKPDWTQTRARLIDWWNGSGLAVFLTAPRPQPHEPLPRPDPPVDLVGRWLDPVYRCSQAEYNLANQEFFAEGFPIFDPQIGPGSLGAFLGARVQLAETTVWYFPCISDPDAYGPIRLNTADNPWLEAHLALLEEGLRRVNGRYRIGFPDLIENMDTLAALRGDTPLLFDLIERPEWVSERLAEINTAFFKAFDIFFDRLKDEDGGNVFGAFSLWGPGKTAKVQCDISANISPTMFRRFVAPHLTAQCEWLDFSMYHLDGTTALQHLDPLLEIEPLQAIEWTPQDSLPGGGGSPQWYDLYRRIKAGGKSVQAVNVRPDELIPLLDAVGPQGMYVLMTDMTLKQAEELVKSLEPYYL